MADLTSFIDFTALFRVSSTGSTLELVNTGTYGVSTTDRWEVRMPSGELRTATGTTASIALPRAQDGGWQTGVYLIQPFVNDGQDDSTIAARPFPQTIRNQEPKPAQRIDYAIPKIVYSDQEDYAQLGFDMPTVSRQWSATRSGSSVVLTSNAATFDLQESGFYYRSLYNVELAATATYVSSSTPWATVIASFIIKDVVTVKLYPTNDEMLAWVKAVKKTKTCGCSGSCGCNNPGNVAYGLYGLVKDYFCAGQADESYCFIEKLYKATHYGMPYRPQFDNGILQAVQLCGGVSQPVKKLGQLTVTTSNILHTSFNFGAATIANANRYKWELFSDNGLTTLLDSGTSSTPAFSFTTATAGGTYYGRMRPEDSTSIYQPGDWVPFNVTTYANLQKTAEPQAATAVNGAASFSITVTGGVPPLVHQWFKNTPPSNTAAVPNSNNRVLNLTGLTPADNGSTFYDIITDADGHTVQSGNGLLTVQSVVPTLNVLRSATSLLAIFSNPAGIDSIVLQHDGTSFSNPVEVIIPTGTTLYEIPNLTPGTLKNLRVKSRKAGQADSGFSTPITKTTFNRRLYKAGSLASDGVTFTLGNNNLQEFHFDAIDYQLTTQSIMKPLEGGTQVGRVDYFDDYLGAECAIRKVSGTMFYGTGTTQATIINGNINT